MRDASPLLNFIRPFANTIENRRLSIRLGRQNLKAFADFLVLFATHHACRFLHRDARIIVHRAS
jgi:hypothetical protein